MKPTCLALPGRFLAVSLLLSAGCSKDRPATASTEGPKPAPATTSSATITVPAPTPSDPVSEMESALDQATLENHDGLAAIQQRMDQGIDALVNTQKSSLNVSVATDQKLDAATNAFAEKLRMLSVARPETWYTAKHDATQALQQVRTALAEVKSSPAR